MSDEYPHDAETVVETLADLYRHQAKSDLVALLESATAEICFEDYDNWNGGQYYHSLHLSIPRKVFAHIEDRIEAIQKSVGSKLTTVFQKTEPHFLTSVVITPQIAARGRQTSPPAPSDAVERIWGSGRIRVFLSHISQHKQEVASLKECLQVYGMSGFVAHEDVEPTRVWQREIETALNTMHILIAILTPGFADSLWADQEVGYALGRGVKTIPIKTGALPHGFLGKQQAMVGNLSKPEALARKIASLVLQDGDLHPRMQDALTKALVESDCWADTQAIVKLLETCDRFPEDQLRLISRALKENSQVKGAFGVPATLKALVDKHSPPKPEDDIPF